MYAAAFGKFSVYFVYFLNIFYNEIWAFGNVVFEYCIFRCLCTCFEGGIIDNNLNASIFCNIK